MNLLFVDGGSRWKIDVEGNFYTDGTYNQEVWNRYLDLCDKLVVIMREDARRFDVETARTSYNSVNNGKMVCVNLTDIYRPKMNAFNVTLINRIKNTIRGEIEKADKVIIRSLGNYYTNISVKLCVAIKKLFLVEVTGFAYESYWYHSAFGKLVAPIKEYQYKTLMKKVNYAIYVTDSALQKRYSCRGKSIGCSDVEIREVSEINIRNKKNNYDEKLIIGTAAFLDVKWKGQKYVISAISELKKQGIRNIEYRLIGSGEGKGLISYAEKLGVRDQVKILGALSHEQVFGWLDKIDVYIQPSFQEGLCRSIVEAMSRGCAVICSNVGGNYELVPRECLFEKGNVSQIVNKIQMMLEYDNLRKYSINSLEKAKKYDSSLLEKKRSEFYREFMRQDAEEK